MFFMFLNHFDVLISKNNFFFKKYIILMYFKIKNILKNYHYYTSKHSQKNYRRLALLLKERGGSY
jgi:hypothetical protein